MKHQASRQPDIVLRSVEKVGVDVVSLETPSQKMEEAVIDAATNSGGNRRIGSETVRVDVCEPDEGLSERTDLADRNT